MSLRMRLFTLLNGQFVGRDEAGNTYYQEKKPKADKKVRRWVMYKGLSEASKVPPVWHGWLHYVYDIPPTSAVKKHPWQKPHQPNQTGTVNAYSPRKFKSSQQAARNPGYEAWSPK